jgi:hypothetical protein
MSDDCWFLIFDWEEGVFTPQTQIGGFLDSEINNRKSAINLKPSCACSLAQSFFQFWTNELLLHVRNCGERPEIFHKT